MVAPRDSLDASIFNGPARSRPNVVVQFFSGFFAIARGVSFLWRTPAAWGLAAVPMAVCLLLSMASIAGSVHFIPQLLAAVWPGLGDTLGSFGAGFVRFIAILIAALIGLYVAAFITPLLSAPALDHLVSVRERALGAPQRPAAGFLREVSCALQAQLVAIGVFSPILLILTILEWALPPAAVATLPLKFLVLAVLLAWSLLDYPLSLRGAALATRVRLMRSGAARVLGFGTALALVFMVPLFPLLLLPAAVAAAAEIALELEQH